MTSPFFSIITPVYNRSHLLKIPIESLTKQTFSNWELIIINDGSQDDIKTVISHYRLTNLVYLSQENKGPSAARNMGINSAKGQYICFLDSDDMYLPNHLEILYNKIKDENFPIAIFRTGMLTKDIDGKTIGKTPFCSQGNPIHFFALNAVGTNTICTHKQVVSKVKFDERFRNFEDTHFFIRALAEFPFIEIEQYTSVCINHPQRSSFTQQDSINYEAIVENNVGAIRDLFTNQNKDILKNIPDYLPQYLYAEKYINHANAALLKGMRKKAYKFITKAIQEDKPLYHWKYYLKFFIKFIFKR